MRWILGGWLGLCLMVGPLQAREPRLTVRILEKQNLRAVMFRDQANQEWIELKVSRGSLTVNDRQMRKFKPEKDGFELRWDGGSRRYPGRVEVFIDGEKEALEFLVHTDLDEYAACVAASESGGDSSQPEYVKALARVVKGYALTHLKRHPGYDLCDLAHCQVFQGLPRDPETWMRWATETGTPGGRRDLYYFHRCCGGTLEDAKNVWDGGKIPPRQDHWKGRVLCSGDPHFSWRRTLSTSKLTKVLRKTGRLKENEEFVSLDVASKTPGGTVRTLILKARLADGQDILLHFPALPFVSDSCRMFGWGLFPSYRFDLATRDGNVLIRGTGLGHGVGLCQTGAMELAKMGWSADAIMNFYFGQE